MTEPRGLRRSRRGPRRAVGGVMAGMIILSLLMSSSFAFLTFIGTLRQQQSSTLVLRAQEKGLELDEDLTLATFNQSAVVGVNVTNNGGLPVQIVHVVVSNATDPSPTGIVGFGQGLDGTRITVDRAQTVTIMTNFTDPAPAQLCPPECYTVRVLTQRGSVHRQEYPPPPPEPLPTEVPLRRHAGNLSYDILTIQWTPRVGNSWPAGKTWHTEDAIPAGSRVVFKVNITNHNTFDLWLHQGTVLVFRGPSSRAQFFVINPAFETSTSISAFNGNNADHARITAESWKWVYFGTQNAGSGQEPNLLPASPTEYATFFAFFGNWDDPPGAPTPDASKYYGQTLPYKGIRTF